MIDAALQLDCPHHVVFISASPLALEKAEIGEGPNRDLIYELYRVLSAKGCKYAFDFRVGKGDKQTAVRSQRLILTLPASSNGMPTEVLLAILSWRFYQLLDSKDECRFSFLCSINLFLKQKHELVFNHLSADF